MNESLYIIFGLIAMVGLQQAFWMRNVQRLVDKAMSRSYTEYVQADTLRALPKKKTKEIEKQDKIIEDDYATVQAERANRAFGM